MKHVISILFILLIFLSCENDLDVNADWEDIPVIYSILDPGSAYEDNTEHYVRVQKSFLGDFPASQMAQETDSIYYNSGQIQLWIDKLQNGEVIESFDLELVTDLEKEGGYFSNEGHQVYKFDAELVENGDPSYDFRINFLNPVTGKEASSITKITEPIKMTKYPTSNFQLSGDIQFGEANPMFFIKDINIRSSKNAKMYTFSLRFNYVEVDTDLQTRDTLFVDWSFSPKTATELQLNGSVLNTTIDFNLNVNDFYKYLASSISAPNSSVFRYPIGVYFQGNEGGQIPGIKFPCIDLYFEALNLDLYSYIISSSDPGLVENRPIFSNISDGAGLFASKSTHNVFGLKFDNNSSDSLSFGRFTKDLNFLYFRELGQGITAYDSNGNIVNYIE